MWKAKRYYTPCLTTVKRKLTRLLRLSFGERPSICSHWNNDFSTEVVNTCRETPDRGRIQEDIFGVEESFYAIVERLTLQVIVVLTFKLAIIRGARALQAFD